MAMGGEECVVGRKEAALAALQGLMDRVMSEDEECRVEAAREIRRLTKTSSKNRRHLSIAIEPLAAMLRSRSVVCNEAALLALLNLAVKDERNKIKLVEAGALVPIISFLCSTNKTLQESATATLLTLTASSVNKPAISDAGAIPILVNILKDGNPQAKVDAVLALYNLSTLPDNLNATLAMQPVSPIISLLKSCKKSSKEAEKCTALLESLLGFEEGRNALTSEEGGILAVVEVLEEGSLQSREHAAGALLTLCESNRGKYREAILKEGAIPGLLQLTIQGTPKSRLKASTLLQLLRDSPSPWSDFQVHTLKDIAAKVDDDDFDHAEKARKMLAEMVRFSMEQSWRHLQQRAGVV